MNDELHAAGFVEETLGDDCILRGNDAEDCAAGDDVFDGLLGGALIEAAFVLEPCDGLRGFGFFARFGESVCALDETRRDVRGPFADFFAELGNLMRKLHRASGSFAAPERNCGSGAVSVFDENRIAANAADAPGSIAEEHDVAA